MEQVQAIARTILAGFNKHYRMFREISTRAAGHFESANWDAALEDSRTRIRMYELRVLEAVKKLQENHPEAAHDDELWPQIKQAYISLLLDHLQAEWPRPSITRSPAGCCTGVTTATPISSGAPR